MTRRLVIVVWFVLVWIEGTMDDEYLWTTFIASNDNARRSIPIEET